VEKLDLDWILRRQISSVDIAISTPSRSGRQYWHNSVSRWERDGQSSYVDNRLNYGEVPVNREIERSYGHYTELVNSPSPGDIRATPSARMLRVNFRDVEIVFDKKKNASLLIIKLQLAKNSSQNTEFFAMFNWCIEIIVQMTRIIDLYFLIDLWVFSRQKRTFMA